MSIAVTSHITPCRFYGEGAWRASSAEAASDVFDPSTGEIIGRVPHLTAAEVDATVRAAHEAFRSWRNVSPFVRARYLFKYRELLDRHRDDIARGITREHGKTLEDARGSVQRGIEVVEFACGIPTLLMGETLEQVSGGVDCYSVRQPLGVCVGITPFNFPVMVPLWMLPLAIACGNTFVLKPSDKVPHTAQRLVELLYEAGLPPSVVSLVHGGPAQVEALIDHPLVRAVSIVGSTAAASSVYARAAARGKRVQALGGAKNHMVALPDADVERTVDSIIGSAFGSAGQRCMAGSVLIAVGDAADRLLPRLVARAGAMRVDAGTCEGVEMGPMITADQRRRAESYIDIGVGEGAVLALDGRRNAPRSGGFFLGATILDHVKPGMRVARDEIFGPVLSIVRVDTLDDALALIAQSPMGNAAVIFTRDAGSIRTFVREADAGMIGVNVGVPVPVAVFPFSGWKQSFFGDLHAHGKDGVRFYTASKIVTSRVSR
ncbi:MAG: CoA-acylating methylmalonate-semialdehyde dehydrogenase [Acidobacteria bacterium]|nr:CoA-acylating methylmalonate-semialdehyde dehydrogenase [Acidobacteriota bacterium]